MKYTCYLYILQCTLKNTRRTTEHVQFILLLLKHKIPATILSRCLHFNLQPLTTAQITKHIEQVLTQENIFDLDALAHIAQAAR